MDKVQGINTMREKQREYNGPEDQHVSLPSPSVQEKGEETH